MGRWAQRQIRGGGPPSSSCITITDALVIDSDRLRCTFSADVSAIDVGDGNMTDTSTGGVAADTGHGPAANQIEFTNWNAGIGNGESYLFNSNDPAVCSGQTGVMHG